MAASISRKMISKQLTSIRLLDPSYLFVKPSAIDSRYRNLPLTWSSSTIRFSHSESSLVASDNDWTPPMVGRLVTEYDSGHYLFIMATQGLTYTSGKDALTSYVNTLASVLGSVEEAKQRIYLATCEWYCCCFGAKIDDQTKNKLKLLLNVNMVVKDRYANVRDKSPPVHNKFTPFNWNNRLCNMDEYYKSSECKKQGDSNHWLIKVKRPDGGLLSRDEAIEWCTQFLAVFVGRKEAKKRIYVIWCNEPFGFGVEIDKGVIEQLTALPNVQVVEDHTFDIQIKYLGVLVCTTYEDGDQIFGYWSDDEFRSNDDDCYFDDASSNNM